jgi:hypothetical protein
MRKAPLVEREGNSERTIAILMNRMRIHGEICMRLATLEFGSSRSYAKMGFPILSAI